MTAKATPVYGGHLILRSLLLLGTLILWMIPRAQAANTWFVPGDFPTIQAAINAAAAGDAIVVAAGTYHESLFWADKDLTILGAGADTAPNLSIIDPSSANGGPGGRCLITSDLTPAATISGFSFQHGSDPIAGGGMYNVFSSPTVANCTFSNNSAVEGGGMYNFFSSPTLAHCTFSENPASDRGGGMFNTTSSPTLTGCSFVHNSAVQGGGTFNQAASSPTLANCTYNENSAESDGGGMFNLNGSPTLTDCSFIRNSTSRGHGGGML